MSGWDWATSEVPPREVSVLKYLLEERAASIPDKCFVRFEDGSSWTYADAWQATRSAAAGLADLGVRAGDVVFLWLPNGPDFLKAWFGINFLGAAVAAPNTALRGAVLAHMMTLCDARVAIVHASLMPRIAEIGSGPFETIVEVGSPSGLDPGVPVVTGALILDASSKIAPEVTVEPWDTQFILFTSGTTGPSKGAVVTYVQIHDMCRATFGGRLDARDTYLLNMPLFHISGTRAAYGMLMLGGTVALVGGFKTDAFWDVVRRTGSTACVLMGAAASFLENRPAADGDADNPLKFVSMVPLVADPGRWARRFGVDIVTAYGMSELSVPLISDRNPQNIESCGRLRPGYQARIVDDHDREVATGEAGELIVRADRPWTISPGYWRMPDATAEAWRNGWFHTGDSFRRDEDGYYYFVDRKKDAIRRRGENISSYEVETEILSHPAIREAAAIAVASPFGEDEVMAVIVLGEGQDLRPEHLLEYLRPRMAHFMLPRYIRFSSDLPKTPSLRVQKHILRAEGITADSWDREAAGIVVKSEKLVG